jgi:hypothetical protein
MNKQRSIGQFWTLLGVIAGWLIVVCGPGTEVMAQLVIRGTIISCPTIQNKKHFELRDLDDDAEIWTIAKEDLVEALPVTIPDCLPGAEVVMAVKQVAGTPTEIQTKTFRDTLFVRDTNSELTTPQDPQADCDCPSQCGGGLCCETSAGYKTKCVFGVCRITALLCPQ